MAPPSPSDTGVPLLLQTLSKENTYRWLTIKFVLVDLSIPLVFQGLCL